jgi:hypothetical protein
MLEHQLSLRPRDSFLEVYVMLRRADSRAADDQAVARCEQHDTLRRIGVAAMQSRGMVYAGRVWVDGYLSFEYGDRGSARAHIDIELRTDIPQHRVTDMHLKRSVGIMGHLEQHLTRNEPNDPPVLAQVDIDPGRSIEGYARTVLQ